MADDVFANLPDKAKDLGTPLAYCRDRPALARTHRLVRAALRLAFGLAFIGLGLRAYGDADDHPGAGLTIMLALSLIAGSFCLVSAARLALRRQYGGNVRGVVHCPGGLVCVQGNRCLVVPWDDVESVWDGGRRFRTYKGDEVILPTTLEDGIVIGEALYRETFQRMAICSSAMLLGARPATFGPIQVTRDDVAAGDRRVPWADVSRVGAARGRFLVFRGGERLPALDVALAEVPNLHALWAVMERLRERGFGSIVIGPRAEEPPESE